MTLFCFVENETHRNLTVLQYLEIKNGACMEQQELESWP
jgi:hypothetical protein